MYHYFILFNYWMVFRTFSFTYALIVEHLGCSYLFAIMNNPVMNIHRQVFL